jgi:hypothetical protein
MRTLPALEFVELISNAVDGFRTPFTPMPTDVMDNARTFPV